MGMPHEIVFVRHGESEANVVQRFIKAHDKHPNEAEILDRPDWKQRLSPKGIEQASNAREWIKKELGGTACFDLRYVSPYYRARETAGYISDSQEGGWRVDDRIVERSWGVYGTASAEEREATFALTTRQREANPWYAGLDGGESLSSGVLLRFRDFLDTLHREGDKKKVLVVTHGELMWVARYILERMTPEEWESLDDDTTQRIRNCAVLQYSRVNPEDPTDIRTHLRWTRLVYPDFPGSSPNKGEWKTIPTRTEPQGNDLLNQVSQSKPLLSA